MSPLIIMFITDTIRAYLSDMLAFTCSVHAFNLATVMKFTANKLIFMRSHGVQPKKSLTPCLGRHRFFISTTQQST